MEQAAPAEWTEFLVAAEAFQLAAPLKWELFLWLFLSAAREAPITDAEQEAMRAALDELGAEIDAEKERLTDATDKMTAVEAVESAAPDAWAEFVNVGNSLARWSALRRIPMVVTLL